MATLLTFQRYLGDDAILSLPLVNPDDKTPFDPTGCILIFSVKALRSDPDSAARVQKISLVGGITPRLTAGVWYADVALVNSDYALLVENYCYQADIRAQNQTTNQVREVSRGSLTVVLPITQNFTLSIPTYTTTPASLFAALANKVAVPATSGATGVPNQWAQDGDYFYYCTALNTWRRTPLSDWS